MAAHPAASGMKRLARSPQSVRATARGTGMRVLQIAIVRVGLSLAMRPPASIAGGAVLGLGAIAWGVVAIFCAL